MKFSKIIALSALLLGFGFCTSVMAEGGKVAVVDVPAIVAGSKQVQALKDEQTKKNKELGKWLDNVRDEIAKQKDDEAKQKLSKKYEAEFVKKREDNAKEYAKKLTEIDKNITNSIAEQAKLKGYDVVFSKATVLYGGEDLTEEVAKIVK